MAEWNQVGGLFRSLDPRNLGHREDISLLVRVPLQKIKSETREPD